MNNRDHTSEESGSTAQSPGEQSPKGGVFRRIRSTVIFMVLVVVVIGAFFSYDFEKHSTARFVIFEIVFIGLAVKCFYWMRDSYRKR
ncbi:MAG: hypothetical protein GY762_17670 [Proteobacteria bacterium]|nr:hypothetical protein [Pseudomonadota bacterium]